MIVTELTEFGKDKKKVYLDGQFAFVLYKGELSGCHIEEGQELPEEIYKKIMEEILWKRIRQRCLFLLKSMDRTEYQLRQKLRENGYPEELMDRAVNWLKELHYLDDVRYAEHYVRFHGEQKGRKLIQMELSQRGISREIIRTALEMEEGLDEEKAIRGWIQKKGIHLESATPKEKNRLYGFLLRKGFSSSKISKVCREFEDFE